MQVRWLEQCVADVSPEADWLSADELARLGAMRVPKRHDDWRLGRWTAKHAVAMFLGMPSAPSALAAIEIRPADSGAPEVFLNHRPAPVAISISHRQGRSACAIAPAGTIVGCDLEIVEPRSDAFVSDYFTAEEQALVARAPSAERFRLLALLWSAKESTLKALREGLRLDTRSIAVDLGQGFAASMIGSANEPASAGEVWRPLRTRYSINQEFQGWWQCSGDVVRTLISQPASSPPLPL